LKKRRDNLPAAMAAYYRFICRIVDIRASDKDEYINITDAGDHGMRVVINKAGKKDRDKEQLMDVTYDASVTQEIRLYVMAGDDHIIVNTPNAAIKLRVVGTNGSKSYDIQNSDKKVIIYGRTDSINFLGKTSKISKRLSNDTSNTHFVTTNPYNVWMPLINGEINKDDGFLLGLGFKYTGMDGFRKLPYSTVQEVMINHSFETNAFSLNYNGQWMQAIGKADFTLHALVDAPNNTMNFFGRGNGTVLDKTGDYREFYRARFDYYTFEPALRWHTGKGSTFSFGPALQLYHLNPDDNTGRFNSHPELMNSYDATTVDKDKVHFGFIANFISNKKNNNLFPSKGYDLDIKMEGYTGLNSYSRSYFQVKPEFSYFLRLDTAGIFVLSDRIGGGISLGSPAFYQSMFLGGQGNLLGFLKNRFAGQGMVFNNFQARLRLASIPGYILPGQFGVSAFFDTGRVWVSGDHSDKFHYGTGGGLYFAPASMAVLQILAGHSVEGWYPYVAFNFRF
jgi:putative sterol carrier protein